MTAGDVTSPETAVIKLENSSAVGFVTIGEKRRQERWAKYLLKPEKR